MDLNKISLIGTLATEPVPVGTADKPVTRFTLVTEQRFPGRAPWIETTKHEVVASGKLADICVKYLREGARLYVEGQVRSHNGQGPEIVADEMIMLGQRKRDPNVA